MQNSVNSDCLQLDSAYLMTQMETVNE